MLFWLFVIIAALGLILCSVFSDHGELKRLERSKEAAHNQYFYYSMDGSRESIELNRRYKAEYYAAERAYDEAKAKRKHKDIYENIAGGFMIFACIVILIMCLVLLITYSIAPAERAQLEADYEVLSWEVENNVYQDGGDDVVGKKELYNQVREWNGELKKNQYYEKNFWIGIFVPNIYGDLKPIELK